MIAPTGDRANTIRLEASEADCNGRIGCGSPAGAVIGAVDKITRTVRLPLARPDHETWKELRAAAHQAARFGNRMLAGQYAQRVGLIPNGDVKLSATLFAESNDVLSGWVRSAMERKCKAYWRRSGKNVMAGRERVACFSADRALGVRATGLKDGVLFLRDGESYVLGCRIRPGGGEGIRLTLNLSGGTRGDWFIREAVESLWRGVWTPGLVTLRFDTEDHKVDALVAYSRVRPSMPAGGMTATLGPVDERGEVWLRVDGGNRVDFTHHVARMRHMREHFKGIQQRIRRTVGRGRGRRQVYRDLVGRQSFEDWSEGPVHQLSRAIISACAAQDVGALTIMPLGDGDWPAARLEWQLRYKAADAGIIVSEPESTDSTVRAKAAALRKRAITVRRAKDGLRAAAELVAWNRSKSGA